MQIDEWLIVEVSDVRALQCLGPVKLYLDNKLAPIDEGKIVADKNEVHFWLTHTQTPAAVEFWNELFQPLRFTREVEVGVGPEAGPIEARGEVVIDLVVVPTVRFIIWAVLFLAGFLTLIWLGRHTNMLRDGPSSSSDGGRTRYSWNAGFRRLVVERAPRVSGPRRGEPLCGVRRCLAQRPRAAAVDRDTRRQSRWCNDRDPDAVHRAVHRRCTGTRPGLHPLLHGAIDCLGAVVDPVLRWKMAFFRLGQLPFFVLWRYSAERHEIF